MALVLGGIFKDAIIGILAALAHQERVRLSERVTAGLERARKEGRVGGRPRKNYKHDADAKRIRQLREEGQSIREIADEVGISKSTWPASARYLDVHPQRNLSSPRPFERILQHTGLLSN